MSYPTGQFLEPLEPTQKVAIYRVYWTCCPVCGPITDYADTLAEARNAARFHEGKHAKRAEIMASV